MTHKEVREKEGIKHGYLRVWSEPTFMERIFMIWQLLTHKKFEGLDFNSPVYYFGVEDDKKSLSTKKNE
jgi:hypothetical protein